MNSPIEKITEGLDLIAEGLAELAHSFRAIEAGSRPQERPQMEQSATIEAFDRGAVDDGFSVQATSRRARPVSEEGVEYGHEAVCPKHRIPYSDKGRGPFCSAKSDEPRWTSEKGYCQITPKSAAAWLAQHAVGP
jgi:hypothetical protein